MCPLLSYFKSFWGKKQAPFNKYIYNIEYSQIKWLVNKGAKKYIQTHSVNQY